MQKPSYPHTRHGFTLIELLVVVAIIGILMAITIGVAGAVGRGSAEAKARAQIADLGLELEKYKADKGSYPATLAELVTWYETEKYIGTKYKTTDLSSTATPTPIDPWGNGFYYKRINTFVFILGSKGADGKFGIGSTSEAEFGKGDDITK